MMNLSPEEQRALGVVRLFNQNFVSLDSGSHMRIKCTKDGQVEIGLHPTKREFDYANEALFQLEAEAIGISGYSVLLLSVGGIDYPMDNVGYVSIPGSEQLHGQRLRLKLASDPEDTLMLESLNDRAVIMDVLFGYEQNINSMELVVSFSDNNQAQLYEHNDCGVVFINRMMGERFAVMVVLWPQTDIDTRYFGCIRVEVRDPDGPYHQSMPAHLGCALFTDVVPNKTHIVTVEADFSRLDDLIHDPKHF